MLATVADVLAEQGIRVKSLRPGRNEHVLCPKCGGGTSKERSLSVTVDDDGNGAAWICHRGLCGWKDGGRVSDGRANRSAPKQPAPVHTEQQIANRPDWLFDWFADRKIGARVVKKFGVYAGRKWFNEELGEADAIVFPFVWRGEVANRKYRPRAQKQPQAQEKNALQTIFNADAIGETIIWVEGEPDVMALAECGFDHAVSLKDGAPASVNASNQARFEALTTHETELGKVRKIILAGDNDGPGLALREELARRLGRHRCWVATWPLGCKDACDVLRAHGPDAVAAAITAASPYPIEGVHRIQAGTLLALRSMPAPEVSTTGTDATDRVLSLPTEGRLIVLTGIPNHGKTAWARFVMVHTAKQHARRWCVFSPESQPWEQFAAQCAEVFVGKPFYPIAKAPKVRPMEEDEIAKAEAWLEDRVTMLVCDAEDEAPTVDWLLERARACVLRDGATDFVIDPWNEVDQTRGDMSETDFIGRCLQRFKAFALRHGCNVWIVAHPAKPSPLRGNEKRQAPGPYDISGSAHWANKPDLGITIHSPTSGVAELHIWKSRYRRWGQRNSLAKMDYDSHTGKYTTTKAELDEPPSHWLDFDR